MYVSSYGIVTASTSMQQTQKPSSYANKESSDSKFPSLSQSVISTLDTHEDGFRNLISSYRFLVAKDNYKSDGGLVDFKKSSSKDEAKSAYRENSTMFINYRVPTFTQDSNSMLLATMPSELSQLHKRYSAKNMVDTYRANDSYYKVVSSRTA